MGELGVGLLQVRGMRHIMSAGEVCVAVNGWEGVREPGG